MKKIETNIVIDDKKKKKEKVFSFDDNYKEFEKFEEKTLESLSKKFKN